MGKATKLERLVLEQARLRFRTHKGVRTAAGVKIGASAADVDAVCERYAKAALKNERDQKNWPKSETSLEL